MPVGVYIDPQTLIRPIREHFNNPNTLFAVTAANPFGDVDTQAYGFVVYLRAHSTVDYYEKMKAAFINVATIEIGELYGELETSRGEKIYVDVFLVKPNDGSYLTNEEVFDIIREQVLRKK